MKAAKFLFGILVAAFALVAVAIATEAEAQAQTEEAPSYVMPAAFPTPYYSQFLPPYQNFNPFYPLPSVSYVGPQRHPFRQFSPYYYYGGPIQWGSGPATAVPNPSVTVAPAPGFLDAKPAAAASGPITVSAPTGGDAAAAFIEAETETEAEGEADEEAEEEAEADEEADSEEEASFVETEAEPEFQSATYRTAGGVDTDPIATMRAVNAKNQFANAARWADKFDSYNKQYEKKQTQKRIAAMRASSLMEVDAEAAVSSQAAVEAELLAQITAAVKAQKQITSLLAIKTQLHAEAAAVLEEKLEAIIQEEVNSAFQQARAELVASGDLEGESFSLIETQNTQHASNPEAKAAFLQAFDSAFAKAASDL